MPAGSTAPVGETIGLIVENEDEIASVQEQNKGKQPEVSSSDQLELVSNKTEEKPEVQSEIVEKKEKEVVLMSKKAAPSFSSDQINAATSNVSSRVIASPRAKKLASQMGVDLAKVHEPLLNQHPFETVSYTSPSPRDKRQSRMPSSA